jgi:DNA polymerase
VVTGYGREGVAEIRCGKEVLFGAKLLQHVVTGIARDLLVHAMVTVEEAGHPVIGHVHDSIICQVPIASAHKCAEALLQAWRTMPIWALGLVLDAKVSMGRTLLFEGVSGLATSVPSMA